MFYSKTTNNHKIWLEANTERSESNPGRSLGVLTTTQKSLSGRQYLVDELARLWLARHVQNLSRIESGCDGFVLSRIFFVLLDFSAPAGRWDFHGLTLAGGILRRTGANTIRSKSNTK